MPDPWKKQVIRAKANKSPRARLRTINWASQPVDKPDPGFIHSPKRIAVPVFPSTPTRLDLHFYERGRMSVGITGYSVYKEPYVQLYLDVDKTKMRIRSMLAGDYFTVFIITSHQELLIARFQFTEGDYPPRVHIGDSVSSSQTAGDGEHAPHVPLSDEASQNQDVNGEHIPHVVVGDAQRFSVSTGEGEAFPRVVIGEAVALEQALAPGEHAPMVVIADAVKEMIELVGDEYFLKIQVQSELEAMIGSIVFGDSTFGNPWLTPDDQPWLTQDGGLWEAN
jgi:hypothetical protein